MQEPRYAQGERGAGTLCQAADNRQAGRIREANPLNNNNRGNNTSSSNSSSNNNNNRRRGRSNRPGGGSGGGGGGGQQLNRIDSRARGNAPQLLEKYRKLAQDAHLNGDRVQAEYYLQFADHYFRVTADSRVRQDEQRTRPANERWEAGADEGDDGSDFSLDNDFPSFDQPSYNRPPREDRARQEAPAQAERQPAAEPAAASEPVSADNDAGDDGRDGNHDAAAQPNAYEPPANPFVREGRTRGLKPRRDDRRPRTDEPVQRESEPAERDAEPAGLDASMLPASMLPPAIGPRDTAPGDEEPSKPRRGRPRKKPAAGDAGETLETAS